MEDVQNSPADVPIAIDRVGIRGVRLPLRVRDRDAGMQQTVGTVDLAVDLPATRKGTHMSRFVAALDQWDDEVNFESVTRLLEEVKERLGASHTGIVLRFPYFLHKPAPATGIKSTVAYQCCLTAELIEGKVQFMLELDVPVMTVCPCSKAISDEGAHTQRTMVHMALRMTGFTWLEEFVAIAESSGSSPVYSLLKREDEKFVTEDAFAHPVFVEDVVRNAALRLQQHPHVQWFKVEVESMESIHNHNAFACIERTVR